LTLLTTLGVSVRVDGDRLRINAPKGVLTPELQSELAARKATLIDLLSRAQSANGHLPAITHRETTEPRPLSLGQERLWSVAQLTAEASLYNMYLAFRLQGALDVTRLERSFAHLIERHASLRTNFQMVNGQPRQVVRPVERWSLPVVDLTSVPEAEAQVNAIIDREIRFVFNPARDPLFRATLLRLNDQTHVLSLVQHHLISDGWSWDILLNELASVYAGDALPALPIQFADYAEWQREVWQSGALEAQLAYWRRQLAEAPADLVLPFDAPRGTPNLRGARQTLALTSTLTSAVKTASRTAGQTLFMTLATAFGVALHQHTGQSSIVFGSPVACREQPETKTLIGYLNNVLLLRLEAASDPTLREVGERMQQTVTEALAHQEVPLHKILEQPPLDRLQIRRALFALSDGTGQTLRLPGLTVTRLGAYNETATFDLFLTFEDRDSQLVAVLEYARDLFREDTIAHLLEDVQAALVQLVHAPHTRLSRLPMRRRSTPVASTTVYVAPRTPTEEKCVAVWEAVLGVRPISVTANYFEIGGTSLKALQVIERTERLFARPLPLASILQAPTVAQLAALIDRGAAPKKHSSLIPIQPLGAERPLFTVHHGGGGIFEFANVARYLGNAQPVYGLQEPGFESGEARLESLEALAAHYLREIRTVQPDGPYRLAGFCFGGVVAYEMAQQLRQAGQTTEVLFLIDATSPSFSPDGAPIAARVQRHTGRLAQLSLSEKVIYLAGRAAKRLRWEVERRVIDGKHAYRLAAYRAYQSLHRPEPAFLRQYALMDYNGKLLAQYCPREYTGQTVLIRSRQDDFTADYGWNALITPEVQILQMPTADHLEMMIEPNVQLLAQHLRRYLPARPASVRTTEKEIAS
jgi:thioesterase domain-containing protein